MRTTLVVPVAALAITLSLAGCSLQLPSISGQNGSPAGQSAPSATPSASADASGQGGTIQAGSQDGTVGIVTDGSTGTVTDPTGSTGPSAGSPAPADDPTAPAVDPTQDGGSGVPNDGSRASVVVITTDELRADYGPAGVNSDSYDNFVYSTDPSEVVAGLTRAFGAAPTTHSFTDHRIVGSGTEYSWGGFDLFAGASGPVSAFGYTYTVDATAATVNGVPVVAGWDLHVGSSIASVRAIADQNQTEDGQYFGLIDMLSYPGASIGEPVATADTFVLLTADPDNGPITQIDAPMDDFGL